MKLLLNISKISASSCFRLRKTNFFHEFICNLTSSSLFLCERVILN